MTFPAETSSQTTRGGITGALESREPQRRPFLNYRSFIKDHYDGLPGALTAVTGFITGHEALAGRLIRPGAFDVRGCKRILDAGCGNGRYSKFLLREAGPDALLTSFDLSQKMLERARKRLGNPRVTHAAADLTRLPYADATFDAVVSGWVLEHLPDPRPGLRELVRVLKPGGSLFVFNLPRWLIDYGAFLNQQGMLFRHWIACRSASSSAPRPRSFRAL